MKRILTILGIAIIIVIAFIIIKGFSSPSEPQLQEEANVLYGNKETQKITVSEVTHSIFYAPQYVAINLGFFEEEGLDVELINGGGADKVMTAVLSNQVDIGFAGPEAAVYIFNEGKEDYAQVFAQVTKRDGSFLIGRQKEDNFKWENLKGKHILPGRKGGVPYMTFEYVLKQNGLDTENDLNLDTTISFDAMTSSFVGGTADYVTAFEPVASSLEKEGAGYIVASVGSEAGEIPYTAYFAKKSYIENNPEIIQKFTNAIHKGQVWVATHTPEEIAKVALPSFPDSDLDLLTKAIANYKKIGAWKETPEMTEKSFELLQKVMTEAGELSQTAPYEKVINNEFAEKIK